MKQDGTIDAAMRLLQDQVREWDQPLQLEQLALLRRYAELLASYTEANVIGTKETRSIILDHVLDSLGCLNLTSLAWQGKLIDVGSGGGLPGIPLAIARPDLAVTLLEVTQKKVEFLQEACDSLRLMNAKVLNKRAEEAGMQAELRDRHHISVTRALASLPVVVEYCAPFVQEGGWILAMKGRIEQDELMAGEKAARKLGAEVQDVAAVRLLPELEQKQRSIVVLRKTGSTPTGYPRRVGLAKKRPLGN